MIITHWAENPQFYEGYPCLT